MHTTWVCDHCLRAENNCRAARLGHTITLVKRSRCLHCGGVLLLHEDDSWQHIRPVTFVHTPCPS